MQQSRAIVITGVTRGLGRTMAQGFAAAGHTIVGCGRSTDAISKLRKQFDSRHRFDCVDVANDAQVSGWAADAVKAVGPPDLLINNAAVINRNRDLWNVPVDEFSRVIDVNIKGMASVIRHFLPAMLERGSGIVVNFSSGWGWSPSAQVAPYCATRWAVEGLTGAIAQELPAGMAAVPLNPGVIDTEMLRSCIGDDAGHHPNPARWADCAVPFILGLVPEHNGQRLTVE